jgi:hypothetical protein
MKKKQQKIPLNNKQGMAEGEGCCKHIREGDRARS